MKKSFITTIGIDANDGIGGTKPGFWIKVFRCQGYRNGNYLFLKSRHYFHNITPATLSRIRKAQDIIVKCGHRYARKDPACERKNDRSV